MKYPIDQIQPSQLYINRAKLKIINQIIDNEGVEGLEPVPLKDLNGRIISTDGHTRLFALFERNIKKAEIIWDTDELDWDLYQECVNWCIDLNITNISGLKGRVVDNSDYDRLWLQRCQELKIKMGKD